jgi:hypothetical protein
MEELWRVIEDFPDYRVSNFGRIQSKRNKSEWKDMKPSYAGPKGRRYHSVQLRTDKNIRKTVAISTLVATYFLEGYSRGCVRHIDGDKFNDNVTNLEALRSTNNQRKAVEMNGRIYKSILSAYKDCKYEHLPIYNTVTRQLTKSGEYKSLNMKLL